LEITQLIVARHRVVDLEAAGGGDLFELGFLDGVAAEPATHDEELPVRRHRSGVEHLTQPLGQNGRVLPADARQGRRHQFDRVEPRVGVERHDPLRIDSRRRQQWLHHCRGR